MSGHPVFPGADTRRKEHQNPKAKKPSTHFTTDPENMQLLMRLLLSCNQLCVFLSVAQNLDDQPELSGTATQRDPNVSEMETLRQPPPYPVADNGRGDPT